MNRTSMTTFDCNRLGISMKIKQVIRNSQKNSGFVLIESIVSMVIILMAFDLMVLSLDAVRRPENYQQVTFYRCVSLIEGEKFSFKVDGISNDELKLTSPKTNKRYRLMKYKDNVILTGYENGYVPLIERVSAIRFWRKYKQINFEVRYQNGETYHAKIISGSG